MSGKVTLEAHTHACTDHVFCLLQSIRVTFKQMMDFYSEIFYFQNYNSVVCRVRVDTFTLYLEIHLFLTESITNIPAGNLC